MKNCICLSSVCLLILFASASSFAQSATASPIAQGEQPGNPHPICPTVSVSCPSWIDFGEPVKFTSSIRGGNPNAKLTYTWEVVGGELAEGQGTPNIKVIVRGPGSSVLASLTVDGLDPACGKTASCSNSNCGMPPVPTKFDSYDVVSIKQERTRLATFREALKQNGDAQGYILAYGGRRSRADTARKAIDRAKEYLVNRLGMNEARIIMIDAGFREKPTVELWVVPAGAPRPTADPILQPTEVKFRKQRRVRG